MPAPRSPGSPYIPVRTYTVAWPSVMIMPNTGDNNDRCRKRGGKGSGEVRGNVRKQKTKKERITYNN